MTTRLASSASLILLLEPKWGLKKGISMVDSASKYFELRFIATAFNGTTPTLQSAERLESSKLRGRLCC
jgi:hypothetical protein